MFENIGSFFKKIMKTDQKELLVEATSKDAAKERLHIVLMQDRANVSADFLELMKQEIIDVIKKYIVIDEEQIDVRLTNQENEDGTTGAPSLYANIPILNIRNDNKNVALNHVDNKTIQPQDEKVEETPKNEEINTTIIEDEVTENTTEINLEEQDATTEQIPTENIEDDEEDDDDVTFDDLLKVAEEEERKQKEEAEKKEEPKKVASSKRGRKKSTTTKSKKSK